MNIEVLHALRTLKNIRSSSIQNTLQEKKFLKTSLRRYVYTTLTLSKFSKIMFLGGAAALFIKRILIMRPQINPNAKTTLMYCTENQFRQIDFIEKEIIDKQLYSSIDLRDRHKISLKNFKFIMLIIIAIGASFKVLFKPYANRCSIDQFNYLSFIMYYIFSKRLLQYFTPDSKLMIVANDHSIIPLAFASAARTNNLKTAYIQHAHVSNVFPRLRFDLNILDGELAHSIYAKVTPKKSLNKLDIVYRGIEGVERQFKRPDNAQESRNKATIGIFLNVYKEDRLNQLINILSMRSDIENILIRPHPAHPISIKSTSNKVIVSAQGTPLLVDAEQCDLVIGGNSSFHLSVLKYGVPTVYDDQIDDITSDYYGFVENEILYPIYEIEQIQLTDIYQFYLDSKWAKKFKRFDASYKQDREQLNKNIKNAILNMAY